MYTENGTYDLERFVTAQKRDYETAFAEVSAGRKRSHWMWYIFPQIAGLGYSETARYYAIESAQEARAYLNNAYLRDNLVGICRALTALPTDDPGAVFGWPDDLKLHSCVTLFAAVCPEEPVFAAVLQKFFGGAPDENTLRLL